VRAVRVDGKPRHVFALGLGSLKDVETSGRRAYFWQHAVERMVAHGLSERRRAHLIAAMVRKGRGSRRARSTRTSYRTGQRCARSRTGSRGDAAARRRR
jgi:hypothetical protein